MNDNTFFLIIHAWPSLLFLAPPSACYTSHDDDDDDDDNTIHTVVLNSIHLMIV